MSGETLALVPDMRCGLDAQQLNSDCFCVSLDRQAVRRAFENEAGGLADLVEERCPHLFAAHPVFIDQAQLDQITTLIGAVEQVVALPAWQERALRQAPDAIARHDPGARSVFFGYDFHVGPAGLGLIEINTNAGGALLNAALARAQRSCCAAVENLFPREPGPALEQRILDMFMQEWRLAGRSGQPQHVAIVDGSPQQQYLYPEFLLFAALFERAGIEAVIADPTEFEWHDGRLMHGGHAVDLVYNRLTDFTLGTASSAALRAAYLADAVVLTPHPRAHALLADKRNLALLSDPGTLLELGVPAELRKILESGIPRTELVTQEHADRLWEARRRLFFKPAAGFGSRAAYRGDKLTRRVWGEILSGRSGAYVAQALVLPGERVPAGDLAALKFDLRAYVYDGKVQSLSARLYQGQTTNFRTPGGGFAPVYAVPSVVSQGMRCAA